MSDIGILGWLALAAALSFGVLAFAVSPVYFLPTGVNATTAYFAWRINRRHHDSR